MAFKLFKQISRDALYTDLKKIDGKLSCITPKRRYGSRLATSNVTNRKSEKNDKISINSYVDIGNSSQQITKTQTTKQLQPRHLTPYCYDGVINDTTLICTRNEEQKQSDEVIDTLKLNAEEKYRHAAIKLQASRYKTTQKRYKVEKVRPKPVFDIKEAYKHAHLSQQTKHLQPGNIKPFGAVTDIFKASNSKHSKIKYPENAYVRKHAVNAGKDEMHQKRYYSTHILHNSSINLQNAKVQEENSDMETIMSKTSSAIQEAELPKGTLEELEDTSELEISRWPSYSETLKRRSNVKKPLVIYPTLTDFDSALPNKTEKDEIIGVQKRNYHTSICLNRCIFNGKNYSTKSKHHGILGPEYTIMPKLCRLPKFKINEEPREECSVETVCNIPRSDENLKISKKKLPTIPTSDCPCIEDPPLKNVPLKRLEAKPVPEPKMPECTTSDPCPPRADEGLKIKPKTLPKYEPKPCACIEKTYTDVPLIRLKRKEVKEPPRICPVVTSCDTPRADANLQVEKKKLPIIEPKPCPCIEKTHKDVPLKRLPKFCIPEPPKICPSTNECDLPRADDGLKVVPKVLPKLSEECPCVEQHIPTYAPAMKRLNLYVKEPPKCEIEEDNICKVERADKNYRISMKKLPDLPISDCPCLEDPELKDVPLKRLEAKPVPEPKMPECITSDPCPPRADEGLKVKPKTLPKYEPKPCACIEKTYTDVPLIRLKRKEVKEPPRICPVVTICDTPRADDNLQIQKKKLPIIEPKPCPCIEKTHKDVPLKRLPKFCIPEPPKVCPSTNECDLPRADDGLKVVPKVLPKLSEECPCVEQHIPTYAPAMKRLNLYVKEPPKCEIEEDNICKVERADKNYRISMKKLPDLPISDCPCLEDPELKDVPLKRLEAKPVPEPKMPECRTSDPCPPRADEGLKIKPKCLPKYEPKPCACIEKTYTDVPLIRLKRKEVKEPPRVCPDVTVCDTPRADANLQVEKKKLPTIVAKPCPCVETTYKDVELKRLPKFCIPEPPKVCKETTLCTAIRADNNYKSKPKSLPTMILCEKNNEVSFRDYNKSKKFGTRKKYSTCSIVSNSLINFDSFISNKLSSVILYENNYHFMKALASSSVIGRSISTTSSTNKAKEEPKKDAKKCPKIGKTDSKCPKFIAPGCQPPYPRKCTDTTFKFEDCNKQDPPYSAFSELNEEVDDGRISHCNDKQYRHLQPQWPILGDYEKIEDTEPKVDVVDPSKEEECVYKRLNKATCGVTKNCDNFGGQEEPVRARDHIKPEKVGPAGPDESQHAKDGNCPVVMTKPCVEDNKDNKPSGCLQKDTHIKPKTCSEKPAKKKKKPVDCGQKAEKKVAVCANTDRPMRCPPPFPKECKPKQKKSLWERICDFFRARPNCPTPEDYKNEKLRKQAEDAAKKAGLVVCDPKLLEYEKNRKAQKSSTDAIKCPPPATKPKPVEKNKIECEPKKPKPVEKKKIECEPKKPKPVEKKKIECEPKKPTGGNDGKKATPDKCATIKKKPAKKQSNCEKKKEEPSKPSKCKQKDESPKQEICKEQELACPPGECTTLGKVSANNQQDRSKVQCAPPDKERPPPPEEEVFQPAPYAIDKSKCKNFKADCPPRVSFTCKKVKKIPSCQGVEPPYPAFSDSNLIFPKLRDNECTKAVRLAKSRKISYPGINKNSKKNNGGNSKCYSTYACKQNSFLGKNVIEISSIINARMQRNYSTVVLPRNITTFLSNPIKQRTLPVDNITTISFHQNRLFSSNNNKPKDLLEILNMNSNNENINNNIDNNEIALKILKAVEEGLQLLSTTNTITYDNYSKIHRELESLVLTYKGYGNYLPSRDTLINLWPTVNNSQQQSIIASYEDTNLIDDNIMKSITGYHENSIYHYEESERKKTENMQNVLDELLRKISEDEF